MTSMLSTAKGGGTTAKAMTTTGGEADPLMGSSVWETKNLPQPASARSCTDIPCLVIFVVCCGGLVYLMKEVFETGNPKVLFHVKNYKGQLCGIDLPGEPYGYWCTTEGDGGEMGTSIAQYGLDFQHPICVAECPTTTFSTIECYDPNTGGTRAVSSYATHSVAGRYCLPQPGQQILSQITTLQSSHPVEKYFEEGVSATQKGWQLLLGGLGFSLVASFVYILLLECIPGIIIWLFLILVFLISLLCGLTVLASTDLGASLGPIGSLAIGTAGAGIDGIPDSGDNTIDTAIGIGFLLVSFLVLCFTCCFRKAISICIKATETTAVFLIHSPSLFLEPLMNLVVRSLLWLVMIIGFAYLLSTMETDSDVTHNYNLEVDDICKISFYILMWAWLNELISVQSQFIIANAAGRWYFTKHNPQTGEKYAVAGRCCCLVFDGYITSVTHFGSLALGSLLVLLMRPFKLILSVILYAELIIDGAFKKIFCCCNVGVCSCCVNCFRRFFAYFGKLAFIELAISSDCSGCCCAYWKAAKQGADDMYNTRNDFHIDEMDMYHGATWLFTFLGMMFVGATSSAAMVVMSSKLSPWNDTASTNYISDPAALAIIAFVLGAVIALSFMLVYDTAWDALLLCLCKDLKMRRDNPPPATMKEPIAPPEKSGFMSILTCSRYSKQPTHKEVPVPIPVYAHSQLEMTILGEKSQLNGKSGGGGLNSFASSGSVRQFSSS